MTDNVTRFPGAKPTPTRRMTVDERFNDMPKLPKEERIRRRMEIQGRLDLLEELMDAELKAIRNLIALDDL